MTGPRRRSTPKVGIEPRSAALGVDALTTGPTRRSLLKQKVYALVYLYLQYRVHVFAHIHADISSHKGSQHPLYFQLVHPGR